MMPILMYRRFDKLCICMRQIRWKHSGKSVRQSFVNYFVQKHDHTFVRSSPVVPFCDPTVAFVNAGMNQFKGIFLGNAKAPCPRAANSQKCIRVGGKHNDLAVVGTDGYHHTFFEMLGSWSFGDYFKREACELAWNLLIQRYGLSPDRLYVTYFGGDDSLGLAPDTETRDIWNQIGVPSDRILPFGADDNFWEMGLTGPCGPCTEIHVDHIAGRRFAADKVNQGYPDLTELWNLVFMQYNRNDDRSLTELPCRHVDTGMGLERLVAILQGKQSNYDTDLFQPLFQAIHSASKKVPLYQGKFDSEDEKGLDTGYRILADHARMVTVALADGMFPDQNYKLRRVMRKAMLVSDQKFGVKKGLLKELTNHVAESLGEAYPEIWKNMKQIQLIIEHEEELLHSLRKGATTDWQKVIAEKPELQDLDIVEMPGLVSGYNELSMYAKERLVHLNRSTNVPKILPCDLVFKLYDTYGLEEHVVEQLAAVEGFSVDIEGFRNLLNEAKVRSKESFIYELENKTLAESIDKLLSDGLTLTKDDEKYNYTVDNGKCIFPHLESEVKAILVKGSLTSEVGPDIDCSIILDCTNFYHEAGGQASDRGVLKLKDGTRFKVKEVVNKKGYLLHHGSVSEDGGTLCIGDTVILEVDGENRLGNMRNHTATHLLNAALRKFLTVTCQQSSRVTESYLVFDFSVYGETLNSQNIMELEELLQKCVKASAPVNRSTVSSDELFSQGNVTLVPGEVYPEQDIHIIEITVGDILTSREACCGTHVLNTADIKDFCIVSFRAAGSGVRSLKAVTGNLAELVHQSGLEASAKVESLVGEIENFLDSEGIAQQAEHLDSKLQEMKQKLTTGSPVLPYLILCHLLEKLDVIGRRLKESARGMLRDALEVEMQTLLTEKDSLPYLVHFLRCSSEMDSVPLQKATRLCTHVPVLLIAQSEGLVKARCCVPKAFVSESFSAELWMQSVLKVLKSKGMVPKGQDPQLVFNMKGKKLPPANLDNLINIAVDNAIQYAQQHLSRSASSIGVKCVQE